MRRLSLIFLLGGLWLFACGDDDHPGSFASKVGDGAAGADAGTGGAATGGSSGDASVTGGTAGASGSSGGVAGASGGAAGGGGVAGASGGAAGAATGGGGGTSGSGGATGGSGGVAGADASAGGTSGDAGTDAGATVSPWANYYGTSAADAAIGVAADASGNVYVALGVQNGFDFGQGIVGGFVLLKLLPNGALDWYVSIPTAGYSGALAVDSAGNVVYAGNYSGGITLGGTTVIGGSGLFAVRYSPSKTLLASKVWPNSSTGGGDVHSLTTDASNSVIFGVELSGSFDFGNGAVSGSSVSAIVKLDSSLAGVWTRNGTNVRIRRVKALANGDVALIGWGYGAMSFGGTSVTTVNSGNDFFIGRLSSNGTQTLLKAIGGTGQETSISGTASPTGVFYLSGGFTGSIDFGGGPLTSTPTPPPPGDPFVASLDANGNYVFAKFVAVGFAHDLTNAAIGPTGRLHVAGFMSGSVDYGTGTLTSGGEMDALLLELSATNGAALRARRWGADGIQGFVGVAPTANGDVVLALSNSGTFDLGGGPVISGSPDPFVALLPP